MNEAIIRPSGRPLLIVITESTDLPRLRSRDRRVRTWTPDGAVSAHGFSGDPTDPASYGWALNATAVTAIIELHPPDRAQSALQAIRTVRPDAAVLMLSDGLRHSGRRDGTLARAGGLRDVLRLDLDEELERLEAERRAWCLRRFVEGDGVVPILVHAEPDPDALSSALAVRMLVGATDRMPILTSGGIHRPENRRMIERLSIDVERVEPSDVQRYDRMITVDTQPRGLQRDGRPKLAVLDHHPPESGYEATFVDIRPECGATATMLTQYLRAVGGRMDATLATALLLGIKTDTDALTRATSAADIAAYGYLQERTDPLLLLRLERPSYAESTARTFGAALAQAVMEDGLCVAFVGELDAEQGHATADLADLCRSIEGITWVAVAAVIGGRLSISLRYSGSGATGDAGAVARRLAGAEGDGGGHATMARATLDAARARRLLRDGGADPATSVHRAVRQAIAAAQA